jgi:glycosyltransferase involved in cell wall biosynthesis
VSVLSAEERAPQGAQAPPALDVSVVVPVYGGERTIETLADGLAAVAQREGWTWELLFVCDRPRDGSWEIARRLAEERSEVRAWRLARNFGQHPATLLGLREARGAVIATLDEDLQHSPEDLPALVEAARSIDGIAYGTFEEPRHEWWRNLTSRLVRSFLARYVGTRIASHATAFRAFPAHLRQSFASFRGERVAIDVLLSWSGAPFCCVPTRHAPRAEGRSGYTFRKLVAYLGDLIVGYSTAPLRLASFLGLVAMVLALGIGGYVLVNWLLHGSAVPGFAFLGLSIAILGAAQLLALGVIGEYLGRLYFNSLGKPQYVVGERVPTRPPEGAYVAPSGERTGPDHA